MLAHPTYLFGRDAGDESVGLDGTVDHRARGDKGILADGDSTNHRAVRSERGALSHDGIPVLVLAGHRGTWIVNVGENHAGTAEYVVFQRDVVVYRNVILNFAVIADDDTIADEDVLAERAVPSYARARAYVAPVPDTSAFSNVSALVNDCARVHGVVHCRYSMAGDVYDRGTSDPCLARNLDTALKVSRIQ